MKNCLCLIFIILTISLNSISSIPLKFKFQTKSFPIIQSQVINSFIELPKSKVISYQEMDCIEVCIGDPKQCFNLVIHGGSFHMWVVDQKGEQKIKNKFNTTMSNTLEKNTTQINVFYGDDSVIGYQGTDYIWISNRKIEKKLTFLISLAAETFTDYEGIIGLGYTPSSYQEKFSFLNQLYNKKIIFHKVFTQSFEGSIKGELSFGEIPKYIVDDYRNYGRCKAIDKIKGGITYKNPKWQCTINGVFYGEKYHEFNVKKLDDHVSFFSYRKEALIPKLFFEYLEQTYFKELIESNICHTALLNRLYDTFLCSTDYTPKVDLNLIYGDWGMKIPAKDLFVMNTEKNRLQFIFSHKVDYEKWTLGRPIVRMFHMVYDAQNEEIGFYSKEKVIRISNKEIKPPKTYSEILEDDAPKAAPSDKGKGEIKQAEVEIGEEGVVQRDFSSSITNTTKLQIILSIFIILGILALLLITFISWNKYRINNKNKRLKFIQDNQQI